MAEASLSVRADTGDLLAALGKAMRAEEDGKALRKDLMTELKHAAVPIVEDARAAATGMPSAGLEHDGEPLRNAIARRIVAEVRFGGRATGVRVKAKRKGMPRGFEHAPKRTNAAGGWRHKVFAREGKEDVWVTQVGQPRWFDDASARHRPEARAACIEAMNRMASRIAARVRARGGR